MRRKGQETAAGDARIHCNDSSWQPGLIAVELAVRRGQRRPLDGILEKHVALEPDGWRRLEADDQLMCAWA